MRLQKFTSLLISLLITASPIAAQRRRPVAAPVILEKNIRAELGFLASDAMQGRGSGTAFERLAAEYIGSQFHQFGLEPAGDNDASGKATFVQRATLTGQKFTDAPTLSVTSGSETKKWVFGKDLVVASLRAPKISGELQIIDADTAPTKGAIALIKLPENIDPQKRGEVIRKARAAHANGVLVPELEANRKAREGGTMRLPNLAARFDGANESPFVAISLSKQAFESIAMMPAGSQVEFGGPTQASAESYTWNAVGVLRGSDPRAAKEVIMLSAHLDHLGVNETTQATGDGVFNGADDDASGCVAVLELARALASGKRPRRTIYFICFGSEERGGYGAQYFTAHSPVPLQQIVADVTFEMLGRPDSKVPANTLWLTGYERSTLGPALAKHGALLVADPHPEQNFFQRSDNYTLALRGVVAHTVSSFGLHNDYHRPSDDISKIDFPFMTRSITSMLTPIKWLADSNFKPEWLPGQAPTR